jgi:UDP-N-acetylmuramyl pentapeptide phosphotransferase/UDP-N-acetylglucosamine-1-phosphate transferase
MPLIQFVIVLVVVGVILWLVNTYIPMSSAIKGVLNVAVIIAVIIFSLNTFGLMDSVAGLRIGR